MWCRESGASESVLRDDEVPGLLERSPPRTIRRVPLQECLHFFTVAIGDGLNVRNGSTPTDNGDVLTLELNRVQQLSKISSCSCSAYFCHIIRLSDNTGPRPDLHIHRRAPWAMSVLRVVDNEANLVHLSLSAELLRDVVSRLEESLVSHSQRVSLPYS